MSVAFTEINRGSDLQSKKFKSEMTIAEMQAVVSKTILDEISLAYAERRMGNVSIFGNIHLVSLWNGIQSWIENNCLNFINHVTGPLNGAGNGFLYFDLATFRSEAGLNSEGFRRVKNWDGISAPIYEYGLMQRGDIVGPWIYEDLQKAFSTLRWTLQTHLGLSSGKAFNSEEAELPYWYEIPWSEEASGYVYSVASLHEYLEEYDYHYYNITRTKGKGVVDELPIFVSHEADFYLLPTVEATIWGYPATWNDLDAIGFIGENKMQLFQSFSSSTSSSHESDMIGNIETIPSFVGLNEAFGVDCHYAYWLLKWNFTNANP